MSEYTPKKKKQKTLAKRPPLAPTKKSNHARQDDDDEEESRWDQEEMCVTSCRGVQHRDSHDMTGVDTTIDTIAPWNSPYVHNKTTQEDPRRHHLQPEDRMPSLDGLELLEMMSFDEYDDYQAGDDDQSLCYSVVSEGS